MLRRFSIPTLCPLALAVALPAQWTEAGDAGQTKTTAQWPTGTIVNLTTIDGTLTVGDVDIYLIEIADVAAFNATTVGMAAPFDTQLFLFFPDGRGVTHNDDSAATPQSTLTNANVPYPGTYLLAISGYNSDPVAAGGTIWNNQPFGTERKPDGARRFETFDSWSGGGAAGTYTITLAGCKRPGKTVVAPDNHHFSESATQSGVTGSTAWWRGAGGRFQVLYESTHFTNAGCTGSVWIDGLLFRGEDGETNLGGQQWANVSVTIATTPLTAATLGNDFAANLATATTSATANFATVTVAPSIGSYPNNYNIRLDLYAAIFGYLYNTGGGNLLVDVTLPTAATLPTASGPVMPMADTTGAATLVRGRGVNTATPTAATGTLSSLPPVMAFKIDGTGGAPAPVVARNEKYGAACGGSPSTFYQSFVNGELFDIAGLTLTPDNVAAPTFYNVSYGAPAFDATKVNGTPSSIVDDGTVTHALGFTFNFPGGNTASIGACTNGYVWLDGTSTAADFTPTVDDLLGVVSNPARLMPFWYDFNAGRNTATHPNSGLHVLTDTSGGPGNAVCYVTWSNVGVFNSVSGTGIGGHAVYNMQCAIFEATGVVEFRYGEMPVYCANAEPPNPIWAGFTGFTRGRIGATPSVDPQSRDLSIETPFATKVEGAAGNIGQRVVASPAAGGTHFGGRAFAGQTLTFNAVNVPAGGLVGVQLLDFVGNQPGVSIPGIHATGCVQSTSLSPVLHEVVFLPPTSVTGTVPVVVPAGAEGFELLAQYVMLDGLFGGPNLVTSTSNAVRIRVGRQ